MNGESRLEPPCVRRWDPMVYRQSLPRERRRSERVPVSLAFDVYDRCRYLGRFWTRDVSQEGLFLNAKCADTMRNTILSLRFCADGVERCLRGTAVHGVPGEGVGIQLAFWRQRDHADHCAYRQLISTDSPARQGRL